MSQTSQTVVARKGVPRRMHKRSSRRISGGMGMGMSMVSMGTSAPMVLASGVASGSSQRSVAEMKTTSQKEKQQMQGLNSKLANHIEKTRMLEAENKYLKDLLNKTKVEFDVDVIKIAYQEQLDDLKALLEDKDKKLAELESQNESLEELVEDLREQLQQVQDERDRVQLEIDGLHDEVAARIADSETSRRRTAELEKQLGDWKNRNGILEAQLAELRAKLQLETTQRLDLANRLELLEEELAFLNDVHSAEIKEYQAMLSRSQKVPQFQESWKAEIGTMITDLSQEYEARLQQMTTSLEARHASQLQQLKAGAKPEMASQASTENRRSRLGESDMSGRLSEYETQISNMKRRMAELETLLHESEEGRSLDNAANQHTISELRMELESMLKELENLIDTKLSLELEIAAYRKLLEGEESRMSSSSVLTSMGGFQSESESALASALASSKVTMSRSTTGTVGVVELETEGRYIEIEDLAKFPKGATTMKNWTLTQTLDGGKIHTHKFTDGNVFSSGKMIKIWGSKHGAGQGGITASGVSEWATMAMPSTITLKDDRNKESAVLVIKTNS